MANWIFRKEWTIRKQMQVGFISLTSCALLTVFLVALIVVLALAGSTSVTAEGNLENRLKDHSLLTTNEIARVIGQKLELISETIVMTLASQSEALLSLKVGGDSPDAAAWPYNKRTVVRDYILCDQTEVDASYANNAEWCSKGFVKVDKDTGMAIKECSKIFDKGVGWPKPTECMISGGAWTGLRPNGVSDTDWANWSAESEDKSQFLKNIGWGSGANEITRSRPPGCTTECASRYGSEKYSGVGFQISNAGCDFEQFKVGTQQIYGSCSGTNCCSSAEWTSSQNGGSFTAHTTDAWEKMLGTNVEGTTISFKPVIDRTQLLDLYADPLWQEFKELTSIYVAYQSPKLDYKSDGGGKATPVNKSKKYHAIMRRFPAEYQAGNNYDPTKRGWWGAAQDRYITDKDSVIITPAYRDFGTRTWMVTISKAFEWDQYQSDVTGESVPSGRGVASVDVELDDIQAQILAIDFTGGFAGLIHLKTKQVLALNGLTIDSTECQYGKPDFCGDSTCKEKCSKVLELQQLEAGFPDEDMTKFSAGEAATTEYKRKVCPENKKTCEDGDKVEEEWVVAFSPAFNRELGIMLFAPKSQIKKTVQELAATVGETTGTVVGVVIAVVAITAIITFVVVWFVIRAVARPLKNIERVSTEIVQTSADSNRNFRSHLKRIENVDKGDEIGELVHSFRAMVRGLHDADVKKRKAPKYPENTLYNKKGGPWETALRLQSNF